MNRAGLNILCLLCVAVWGTFAGSREHCVAAASRPAQERFVKEAAGQWLEYRKLVSRHVELTTECRCYENRPRRKLVLYSKGSSLLDFDKKCARDTYDQGLEDGGKRLAIGRASNPKYHFEVERGQGSTWLVREVVISPPRIPDDLIGRDRDPGSVNVSGDTTTVYSSVIGGACLGQTLWGTWLPLLVLSPDFKLIRATYMGNEGELVKVEFQFEPKERTRGNAPARSGMVVLDTRRYWLIREAETKANFNYVAAVGQDKTPTIATATGKLKIVNTFGSYTDGALSVPFVSHQVMRVSNPNDGEGNPREDDWITDMEMHAAPSIDPKEFTLSAFGLPEPGEVRHNRPWLFWAVLFLLTSITLLVYRRWRRPQGA
jgi:hypothetical protein